MSGTKENKLKNVLRLTDLLCLSHDSSDPENMSLMSDLVTDEESLHFGFFGDQSTAIKMLETKAERERNHDITDKFIHYQLMASNVESLLIDAAENKRLTDFLMAAAATVSRKFYNEMCQKYAEQLIEEKYFKKAALYLTFCGELHSAVKILVDKGLYLDSLALAKSRFPEDDPFIRGVLLKVSNHFSAHHEIEFEAECYLSMNEPAEAAKSLYRIGNSSSIYGSAYICKKFNLPEEAESYGYMCMEKCLSEAAWPTFYEVINVIDSLKVYKLLVRVHELIFTEMKALKSDGIYVSKLFGVTGNKLPIWKSKEFGNSNLSFLPYVYDDLKSNNIIPEDKESVEKIKDALDSFITRRQKHDTSEEAHIAIAIHISQAIVSALLDDLDSVQKHILKVFPTAYNVAFLPRVSLWLLFPFDVYWCSSKDVIITENKYSESQVLPFPYLQDIYKSWCAKISEINASAVEGFSVSHAFMSDLNKVVEQVSVNLSKKTSEDSLILYFSACFIEELRRLARHGWKFRCYLNSCNQESEQVMHENGNSNVMSNENNSEKNICNTEITVKEQNVKSEINCCKNASENIVSNLLLVEEDITMQYEVISPFSPGDKENSNFNNCESIPTAESDLTESSSPVLPVVKENGTATKNGVIECFNSTFESKLVSTTKNNYIKAEADAFLHNVNGKIEEKEINFEHINDNDKTEESENRSSSELSQQVEEISSEDDHLQCWSDVSLFHTLAKIFTSNNCKDEYALFFYLQKYLHYLGCAIADITRQKSVKSALNNPKELLHTVEGESPLNKDKEVSNNLIESEKNQENRTVSCTSKNLEIPEEVNPKELSHIIENESPSNKNNICNYMIDTDKSHPENLISSSSKNIDLIDSKECNSNSNYENDCSILEKEIEKVSEVQIENYLIMNKNEKDELTDETNINLPNHVGDEDSTLKHHENADVTEEQTKIEKLHSEQEQVSHLLKLLNLMELDYPNPFIAVRAINAVCYDIFRKNPCSLVKKKFHEFAHEVNKWHAKFNVPGETLKCDICKEEIFV